MEPLLMGWAPPGTNPLVSGLRLPKKLDKMTLTEFQYRQRISNRYLVLTEEARARLTPTAFLNLMKQQLNLRVDPEEPVDLLEAKPELYDLITEGMEGRFPLPLMDDRTLLATLDQAKLEDVLFAMGGEGETIPI